ncbi:hypothetical protein B0H14DRAFT_2595784 [Mycena olivaceomarginata]|nr:hypothetical protein B0H14DRAFT_2595784 [Mycena olivaceomarginata]
MCARPRSGRPVSHLILRQRAALERDAGYNRMVSQISLVRDIEEWGKYQERRAREEAETAARTQRRRERKAAEGLAEWEKRQPAGGPIRRTPSLRLVNRRGSREPREVPLTEDDLYLDESRPPFVTFLPLDLRHLCNLCHNIKSHPVRYKCGHSNCYVCIRVELETSWSCPTCDQRITARPVPHQEEAAAIDAAYPEWDQSRVDYQWDGLNKLTTHRLEGHALRITHDTRSVKRLAFTDPATSQRPCDNELKRDHVRDGIGIATVYERSRLPFDSYHARWTGPAILDSGMLPHQYWDMPPLVDAESATDITDDVSTWTGLALAAQPLPPYMDMMITWRRHNSQDPHFEEISCENGVELLLEVGTAACFFSLKPRAAGLFSKPTAMPPHLQLLRGNYMILVAQARHAQTGFCVAFISIPINHNRKKEWVGLETTDLRWSGTFWAAKETGTGKEERNRGVT